MHNASDGSCEPCDLPEPGTPEFLAGLANDEFAEACNHLRSLRDWKHEIAEDIVHRWRQALDSLTDG